MLKKLKNNKYLPVGFIIFIWFIFSFPYIFLNKVPYPSDYQVNKFIPWSQNEKTLSPIKNEAIPDVIGQIYPWRYFTISQWKEGQIPLWNQYSFAGTPHLANYQSAVFSPFNIIFFILPFIDAWSIAILHQPLIAGVGTYMFLRSKKLEKVPSLIGATAFMFSGFMVVWMAYGTLSMAAALLPLALFAIEKFLITKDLKYVFLIVFSLTASFFSGHFQTSLYVLVFSILYSVFCIYSKKTPIRTSLFVSAGFVLSILIASIQILPTIKFYQQSVRESLTVASGGIPFTYLITLIAPDFFGNPVTRNDWYGYYAEWSSFVGVIPLILSLFAIFAKKNKDVMFFTVAAVVFLLLATDGPLQKLMIATGLPIFSTSMPSRIILLFSFSLSVLAAYGAKSFSELIEKNKLKKIIPIILAVMLSLMLIPISIYLFNTIPQEHKGLALKNILLPITLSVLFLIVSLCSIWFRTIRPHALLILLLLLSFDSLRFATKWMPFSERQNVYQDTEVVKNLQRLNDHGRVAGNYAAYVDTYYQIPSLEGFDSLYIKEYGEFIEAAVDGKYHTSQRNTVHLARNGKYTERVLQTLGVTHFFHVKNDTKKTWAYPVWADKNKYKKIYSDSDFEIYKYANSLPRARMYYKFDIQENPKDLLEKFYSEEFDHNKILLLEERVDIDSSKSNNKVDFVVDTPNRVVIKVNTQNPGMLFLADPIYSNWKAKVNGKKEKIYRANYAFRAVKVPQGESIAEFYFSFF